MGGRGNKQLRRHRLLSIVLGISLLVGFVGLFGLLAPAPALAVGGDITIEGPGLKNPGPITVTQRQLRGVDPLPPELQSVSGLVYLPQHDEWYSTINTWPTKNWYRGEGVKLTDLLKLAGGLKPEATLIKFHASDGFVATFTVQELLNEPRYRFPNFMNTGVQGHIPGDPSGAVPVEAIIAHRSFSTQNIEDITDDSNFSRNDANHLLYGQRAVTQQTNARFAKYTVKIQVLTDPVQKWANPTASVPPGEVPVGTKVELHSTYDDEDKVHYTLDGSDPTIHSPMYNWIASRWWSSRQDVLDEINKPIEITQNTTIKAFVTGPGRYDSDIVTFEYTVPTVAVTGVSIAEGDQVELQVGQTKQLTAVVQPENATNKGVTWSSSDEAVATVDEDGLVTAVSAGTATITVTTEDGNFTDSITVTVVPATGTVTGVSIAEGDRVELKVGQTKQLTAVVQPANATNKAVTWSSSNEEVATVDQTGLVTAVKEGTATITVTTQEGGYTDSITVTVVPATGPQPGGKVVLTVTGPGVNGTKEFTQAELEEMPQYEEVYSCINTWPTKKWYVGRGVRLTDLLDAAGGIKPGATLIRFYASDGYYMTLTVQELLRDRRYRFPNFKSGGGDADGHIPGDPSGAVEVETIIGLVSAEGTDDPSYMNDTNTPILMLGQRAVTEQTGPLFVKYVNKIEVLTSPVPRWDAPRADPPGGTVPAGTLVRLSNNNMDIDKIHYTTDGSTPDLNSPIYNWIARRWWAARGEKTVAEINHPIEITKDTVIKAITIGPGKEDSEVVTFTYKVIGGQASQSATVSPTEGGTVSLGDEAAIEIPAGALAGTGPVEVKIERVQAPPAAPAGFKLVSGVYEFTVDGKQSYSFKKAVTIKLKFDPEEAGSETPAVHYYDESEKKWVSLGGQVSGNLISVQVDHFTKFAVMVALPTTVTAKIKPGEGGTVSLGDEAAIEIPAGALAGTGPVEVKIEKVTAPPAAPAGYRLVSSVYEFTVDGKPTYSFAKKVTIRLSFDPGALAEGETPCIHRYDQGQGRWINLGGQVAGNTVSAEVEHLSKYAVMVAVKVPQPTFPDTVGHWAENSIEELVALGAIGGYPDGTFKPNKEITRAEFASILVRAFKLEVRKGKVFADTAGHWAQDTIATAASHGLVAGYDADAFGPDDPITREQMAAMMVRAAKLTRVTAEMSFKDAGSISGWAREAVATAVKSGIISGYPDNTLRPRNHATRAEAVTVIVKALKDLGAQG